MNKTNIKYTPDISSDLPAIETAISICGSEKALALCCDVSQQAVNYWRQKGKVPPKYIPAVVKAVDGKVTSQELLADLI